MFLTKQVSIKVSWNNINSLKEYYPNINIGDIIDIEVKYLSKGSHLKIDFKCDICGNEKTIVYKDYIKYNDIKNTYLGYYKCPNCKRKENNNALYGVDNISQLNNVKLKKEETNLKNCGKRFNSQTIDYLEKCKQTNIEKFDVEWSSQNVDVKEKKRKTNISIYGVDNPSKNDVIKTKIKNSNIKTKHKQILSNNDNINDVLNDNFIIKCENNHIFDINRILYYKRRETHTTICTICNPISKNISGLEIELYNFIKNNYNGEIITNIKTIINPLELDIYLPDLKLAFEFNELNWHNELNKPKNYHINKTDKCIEKGIQLIHIWEDNWLYKKNIIKSMILNKLKITPTKIFARKCIIKEVSDNNIIKNFLNNNHIQGFVKSNIKIGLFYENTLVSLMTFNRYENKYDLNRYCNLINLNVIGGASKLFKYFIEKYKPFEIITYADRSYSNGSLYTQLGFEYVHKTKPNYHYIIDDVRIHKSNFKKEFTMKQRFDLNKSEHEIMLDRDIYRIYNSGNLKFIYKKTEIL